VAKRPSTTSGKASAAKTTAAKTTEAPKRRRGRPPRSETVTPNLPGTRVIKRYGNRRLYDHTLSRAVTMNDLAAAVQNYEDFRVFDGESGNDVTRRVLLQIILEQQNETQLNVLPIEFLRLLIQLRSEPLANWMSQYLDAGVGWLGRHLSQAGNATGPALRSLQDSLETMFPWLRREGAAPAPPGAAPASPSSGAEKKGESPRDLADEIVNLQTRLADLAKRVTRR
jgi:polyhydroxyalkanoate synthesis repressor PhaR